MQAYKPTRCKECDAMLWSNHAKQVCLCPDCEIPDSDIIEDLEDRYKRVVDS